MADFAHRNVFPRRTDETRSGETSSDRYQMMFFGLGAKLTVHSWTDIDELVDGFGRGSGAKHVGRKSVRTLRKVQRIFPHQAFFFDESTDELLPAWQTWETPIRISSLGHACIRLLIVFCKPCRVSRSNQSHRSRRTKRCVTVFSSVTNLFRTTLEGNDDEIRRRRISSSTYSAQLSAFIVVDHRSFAGFFEHLLTLLPNTQIQFSAKTWQWFRRELSFDVPSLVVMLQ